MYSRRQPKPVDIAVVGSEFVGKTACVKHLYRLYGVAGSREVAGPFTGWNARRLLVKNRVYTCTDTGPEFCWDRSLQLHTVHSHQIFIIVYAIDDQKSFEEMERLKSLIEVISEERAAIIVVGNKVDKYRAVITSETIDCLVSIDWGLPHIEMSAKFGLNVTKLANTLSVFTGASEITSGVSARHSLPVSVTMHSGIPLNAYRKHSIAIMAICQQNELKFDEWKKLDRPKKNKMLLFIKRQFSM